MSSGGIEKNYNIVVSDELFYKYQAMAPEETFNFKPKYFPTLCKTLQGFKLGELIIISGPTGAGKTLLSQSLLNAFSDSKIACLYLSYEVPTRQFIESFPKGMFPKFYLPEDLKMNSIDWLEEKAIEAYNRFNCKIVFIDHLHYLFDIAKNKSGNSSLDIGGYVRRVKRFIVEHEMIVFLICHITKCEPDEEIGYNKIRDSGMIPQEADDILMVRRLKEHGLAELKICKSRRAGYMSYKIPLIKRYGYLWETMAN